MTTEDALEAALARKGFAVTRRRADVVLLARLAEQRHDHVRVDLAPDAWWRRWARRPRRVVGLVAGVVWPIGEQAFARPVPDNPLVPQQAHAAMGFGALCREGIDAATAAAAVDDWFRRLEDPGVALDVGAISEPVRRLEFAVVTSRREVGVEAATAARTAADDLPPARRTQELARIDRAVERLPRT